MPALDHATNFKLEKINIACYRLVFYLELFKFSIFTNLINLILNSLHTFEVLVKSIYNSVILS